MDLFIFGAFLIATLIVGLQAGRRVKTIQDYALGGKNFSTLTLTATIVATWFGGGSLYYTLANTYSQGVVFLISMMGVPIGLFITGQVLAIRMREFLNNVSVAEAMGNMYGKEVRIISAISGIIGQIGYVAMQFRVISNILTLFWGVQYEWITLLAAVIVILYSMMGGIRAVTFTDVLQFFTFGTFLPILAIIVWSQLQDPQRVTEILIHNPNFNFREVVGWNTNFIGAIALMLYFSMVGLTPSGFQRVAMARNTKQARSAFTYSALLALLIISCIAWVAILLLAENAHLEPSMLVNYLLDRYTYTGFKGLLAAGIVALSMSTADSEINACAVLFANDLAVPLGVKVTQSTFVARLFALVVGVLGLLLIMYENDLLSLLLFTGGFYMPIVGVPLWLSILGFRSTKRSVFIGMAAGLTALFLWRTFFAYTGIDAVMPATFAGLLFLLGSHYLLGEPGGWQKVTLDSPLAIARATRKEARKKRLKAIKDFKLYPYLQQSLPQQEGLYALFGLYTIAATYTGFYTIGDSGIQSHREIYEGIYHTMLFATTGFLTFPIWPPTVKSYRFITFFWPLGIGAILFFAGTLLVVISDFHTMQVMVLTINLMIAILLLQWSLAIILALSGISLAALFFQYYTGEELLWNMTGSLQFNVLYGLLLITSLLIAFFGNKRSFAQLGKRNKALQTREKGHQESLLQVIAEKQATLAALQHTGSEKLLTIMRTLQTLHVVEEDKEKMKSLQTELLPIAFHLQGIDTKSQDYLRLKAAKLTLKSWCDQIKAEATRKGVTLSIYCRHDAKAGEINCDAALLTSLLVKSMLALNEQVAGLEDKPDLLFLLEDTQLSYPLPDVKKGYMKYVPALRISLTVGGDLPPSEKSYQPDLAGPSYAAPATAQDLSRLANSRIIKSHYGYAEVTDDTLIYVVPIDIEDVRPKDMDKEYMEVGAKPIRADDHFKNDKGIDAQAQEATFLADVATRSNADLGMIKMALETIKWYHGPKNRNSGEPFYLHPLAVAQIVLDYNQDEATIIGALLHDTVEDTPMQLEHIEALFGKEAAEVVDVVTHLQSIGGSIYKVKMSASENLQMLDRTDRQRGLYVKIADRMHNMRTINGHSKLSKRRLIAQETLDFFIPLSEKLGLYKAAQEFEKMCLKVLAEKK